MVNTINMKLQELGAQFKTQSASWMDANNLVLIVPTPDDANNMVIKFKKWLTSLPMKASHAQLDTKTYQIVIQCAYIHNNHNKLMTPAEEEDASTTTLHTGCTDYTGQCQPWPHHDHIQK